MLLEKSRRVSYEPVYATMDINKSKILLKKINALHESAEAFDNSMSKMERDLLLHYLREMYELVLDDANSAFGMEDLVYQKERPMRAKPLEPRQDVQVSSPAMPVQEAKEDTSDSSSNGQMTPEVEVTKVSLEEEKKDEKLTIDPDIEALFDTKTSNDLSDRFRSLPIANIGRSMGINDRILTTNELFGGNQEAFNTCVDTLNDMSNFEEAKAYLVSDIATKYKWASPKRAKKAMVFLALIRRRYL